MAVKTTALTTLARLKQFLGISGTTNDTTLEYIIDSCTDFIQTYCRRAFKLATYTQEVYDGTGSSILYLKNYPITTFTLLEYRDSDDASSSNWSTIDSDEYFHIDNSGMLNYYPHTFLKIPQHYRATYAAGYDFDTITLTKTLTSVGLGDLEMAMWKLCGSVYNQRKSTTGIQSESIGDYSVSFASVLDKNKEIKEILDRHRKPLGF